MKLSEFKKLEESIKDQDFSKSFKNINKVMFSLSIFGNITSIFLAFFLVSKVLSGAIDNPILVGVASVILLGGLELLKREIFDKFSLQQIKHNSFYNKDVLPLMITSILIVSLSFYASIKGAKEFSNKSKQIDNQVQLNVDTYKDSLSKSYQLKIEDFNKEIKVSKDKLAEKDNEQTLIESSQPLSPQEKSRVKDLKIEKSEIKNEISTLDTKVFNTKKELDSTINEYKSKVEIEGENKKGENKSNSFFFIMISLLIELIILAGIYFNEYYKYRSYVDFKLKIDQDPNFQKWHNYNAFLDIIYPRNYKVNDRLPSIKSLLDLCKINGVILMQKDISDLFRIFLSLGIIKGTSTKYIAVTKETSQDILKNHFKVE